jgi:alpha-galactosidase
VDWKSFKVFDELSARTFDTTSKDVFIIRDLWLKKEIGDTRKPLQATIGVEDVLCLKITKKPVKSRK